MKTHELIKNSHLITNIYGRWPCFHDFEITRVVFDRALDSDADGPFVTISVHMWECLGKSPDGKRFVHGKHHIAHFRCNHVSEYDFNWFNSQNVINDIEVIESKDSNGDSELTVYLPSLYGAETEIKCRSMEVLSVEPGIPKHSVYCE